MYQIIHLILFFAFTLVINACSFMPLKKIHKSYSQSYWYQHQQKIFNINQYQVYGSLIYLSDQQRIHVRFFWQQISENIYRLLLLNMLGNTELELNIKSGQIQLFNNKGKFLSQDNVEKMFIKINSISIPFNNLRQWILGLPGEAINYKVNNHDYLSELSYKQNGKIWKVVYNSYNTKIKPALPSSIEITEGGKYIKLKIDHWIIR